MKEFSMNLQEAFDNQLQTLISKKYHECTSQTEVQFREMVEPLKQHLNNDEYIVDVERGKLSFVIVIKNELVSTEQAMQLIEKDGRHGITKLFPHEPKDFNIIESEVIPSASAYLLLDIDRGKETLNITPQDAMKKIRSEGRLPLTIDEGVAIVTHYPEFLMKNNCFSLLASRHVGDQRVPAIWINGQREPNLGWCWDGNPHTWLGSASAQSRV